MYKYAACWNILWHAKDYIGTIRAKIAHAIFFLLFPVSDVTIIQNTMPKTDAESNTGESEISNNVPDYPKS